MEGKFATPEEHEISFGPLPGNKVIQPSFESYVRVLNPERREICEKIENIPFLRIVEDNLNQKTNVKEIKELLRFKIEYLREKYGVNAYYEGEYIKALNKLG